MAAACTASVPSNDAENRIVGMMVGSAIGDAFGIYTNGLSAKRIKRALYGEQPFAPSYKANELTPQYFPDEHRAQYEDGNWSEATEMALCTLLSHLHDEDGNRLPLRLSHLSRFGNRAYGLLPLDLGQPITDIIEDEDFLDKPSDVALKRWTQRNGGKCDVNGSNAPLVRLHPLVAFSINKSLAQSFDLANENCRKTHVDSRCSIAVFIATALLRALIRREVQTEKQINPLIQRCKRYMDTMERRARHDCKEVPTNLKGAYYSLPSESWTELSRLLTIQDPEDLHLDTGEQGDVWKCLSAGILALRLSMSTLEDPELSDEEREQTRKINFNFIISNLAQEGGAAQANAAFAGALVGAYLGYDHIPERYRKGLSHRSYLMRKCKLLCEWVNVIPSQCGQKKRKESDSALGRGRNARRRQEIKLSSKERRAARLGMLKKRWEDRRIIEDERHRTVYNSLKFPPRTR